MDARQTLVAQFNMATSVLGMIMADVSEDVARSVPAGKIQPIGTIYAHAVSDTDFMLNTMVLQQPMILSGNDWSERTGIPIPQTGLMTEEWLGNLKLNLAEAQEYAKVVFAAYADAVLNSADEALNREVEGPFGKTTGFGLLATLGLYHLSEHSGEIAAIKGVQDLKGLPF